MLEGVPIKRECFNWEYTEFTGKDGMVEQCRRTHKTTGYFVKMSEDEYLSLRRNEIYYADFVVNVGNNVEKIYAQRISNYVERDEINRSVRYAKFALIRIDTLLCWPKLKGMFGL